MTIILSILRFLGGVFLALIIIFLIVTIWERLTRRTRQARILKALGDLGSLSALQLSRIVGMGSASGFIYSALKDLEHDQQVVRTEIDGNTYWHIPRSSP